MDDNTKTVDIAPKPKLLSVDVVIRADELKACGISVTVLKRKKQSEDNHPYGRQHK